MRTFTARWFTQEFSMPLGLYQFFSYFSSPRSTNTTDTPTGPAAKSAGGVRLPIKPESIAPATPLAPLPHREVIVFHPGPPRSRSRPSEDNKVTRRQLELVNLYFNVEKEWGDASPIERNRMLEQIDNAHQDAFRYEVPVAKKLKVDDYIECDFQAIESRFIDALDKQIPPGKRSTIG